MKGVSLTDGGFLSGNKVPCSPLRWSTAPIFRGMGGLWVLYFGPYIIVEDVQIQCWTLLIDQLKIKEQPFAGVMYPLCYVPIPPI